MELRNPSNGETIGELPNPKNGGKSFSDEVDSSSCSTPYVSAPSSPGRNPNRYFFSAPSSPMHYVAAGAFDVKNPDHLLSAGSFEFDGANTIESMISADELFFNGQIRPMKLSSHLQRPQDLAPLLDVDEDDEEEAKLKGEMNSRGRDLRLRSRSMHRRSRSLSPMRNSQFENDLEADLNPDLDPKENETVTPSTSSSSSSSRSSSSRWIFLKDFLYRSKSEGRDRTKEKEKFWHSISFSPSKDKSSKEKAKNKKSVPSATTPLKKPSNGIGKRKGPLPSAHERLYTANRAQAEEMRKRTFLPYRQGLLGCLGFSSRSYGAVNGFARTLNSVSSM